MNPSNPQFSDPQVESELSASRRGGKTFNKKRFWVIIVILTLVEALAFYFAMQWKNNFASDNVSDVYTRYEKYGNLSVSFIKNYRVNDTVCVDVTLLEAKDSIGWNILCKDFYIPVLDSASQKKVDDGEDLIFSARLNKNDLSQPVKDTSDESVIRAFSYLHKNVCIFHTRNKDEDHAVFYYNFDRTVYKKL